MPAATPCDPVALTQALVRCESVTPDEGGALTLLESRAAGAGFTCHRMTFSEPGTPDVENLYARHRHGRPHLCFAGHTDVVPVGDAKPGPSAVRRGDSRRHSLRPRRRRHERRRRLLRRGRAPPSCMTRPQARRLDLVSHHGRRGGPLDQRHHEGARLDARARREGWTPASSASRRTRKRSATRSRSAAAAPSTASSSSTAARGTPPIRRKPTTRCRSWRASSTVSSTPTIDAGTAHFQPSNLQITVISVPNTGRERHSGRSARDVQHSLQRHLGPPAASKTGCATQCGGRRAPRHPLRRHLLRHRRRVPD